MKKKDLNSTLIGDILYVGIALLPESREVLKTVFGDGCSDHVTIAFRNSITMYQLLWCYRMISNNTIIRFSGNRFGEDEKVQALFLNPDSFSIDVPFPEEKRPHITVRVFEGGKPYDSNLIPEENLIEGQDITLYGRIRMWTKQKEEI